MNRSNRGKVDWSITAGADFLQLDASAAPVGGLSDWLTEELRSAISDGRLPVGSRLPATRMLAAELKVSRGVVTEAYQRLTEDGQVAGKGRAGTIVVAAPIGAAPKNKKRTGGAGRGGPSGRRGPGGHGGPGEGRGPGGMGQGERFGLAEPGLEIFDEMRAVPARLDLTPGVPDLAAFPRAAWLRAERAVLSDLESSAFGYGDPAGTSELKRAVAAWIARNRGITADPDDLIIVSGVSQAIALVARTLLEEGIAEVAVEDPGSLGSRQHLRLLGMNTPPVPVDSAGLRVDALRETGARVVMVTPAHQFPTGVVLEGERRRELLQWAADGGLVFEDDYDAEHRYDRPPVPALRALLADQVIYTGSISKLLAPSLRVGWLLPPPQYKERLIGQKRLADLGNSSLPQLTVAHLMESGDLERQLRYLRRRHRERRDAIAAAIAEYLPSATVHGAAAGLHLTITFDQTPDLDDAELAEAALLKGVKTQPLSWHTQRNLPPGLVLGYAARTPTELTDAIKLLGRLVNDAPGDTASTAHRGTLSSPRPTTR